MTSSFDNYNIDNNQSSNNLKNINISLKKSLFNNNITNAKEYVNTIDNFYNKNDKSTQKNITLNKTLKETKSNTLFNRKYMEKSKYWIVLFQSNIGGFRGVR